MKSSSDAGSEVEPERAQALLIDCLGLDSISRRFNGLPAADAFFAGLEAVLNHPLCRLPPWVRVAARGIQGSPQFRPAKYQPRRDGARSPVDGLKTRYPEFCAMVPLPDAPHDIWVRVVLLEGFLSRHADAHHFGLRKVDLTQAELERLATIVYQPPLSWGEGFSQLMHQLHEVLVTPGRRFSRLPSIPDSVFETIPEEWDRDQIRVALVNAYAHLAGLNRSATAPIPGSGGDGAPRAPTNKKSPDRLGALPDPRDLLELPESVVGVLQRDRDDPPPAEEFFDHPVLARAPSPAEILESNGEDASVDTRQEPLPGVRAQELEANAIHHLYLSGSLQPEVARVLPPPAFRAVVRYCLIQSELSSQADPMQAVPWLVLLLEAMTARPADLVLPALVDFFCRREVDRGRFRIEGEGYWTQAPVRSANSSSAVAVPEVFVPWPTTFANCLRDLSNRSVDWSSLTRVDSDDAINAASARIRSEVYAQFSVRRLRNTLPSAIYVGAGDECLAQIVSGSALGHTDAPLYYYSNTHRRIRQSVAWGLSQWLPREWRWKLQRRPDDDHIFGRPRAGIADGYVTGAISALTERADQTPPPKASVAQLCDRHNALTSYVVGLFGACTTHRLTFHLEEVTRRHFVRVAGRAFGFCTFLDKLTVNALSCRVTVVSALLLEQLEIYAAHLGRLVARLEQTPRRNFQAVVALKAALSGDGPLFLFLEGDGQARAATKVRPFQSSDFETLWPEWTYPGYVLRHRFAAYHWKFGISRDDVARQMGHAIDGVAFDESDLDSALAFAERLAGVTGKRRISLLDEALESEGWRVVRSWVPVSVRAPDCSPDRVGNVVNEHSRVMTMHRRLQDQARGRVMGKSVVVGADSKTFAPNHKTLLGAAKAQSERVLAQWLAAPAQSDAVAKKQLSSSAVEQLVLQLGESIDDRRMLVPAVNSLRGWLQRLCLQSGWSVALPSPVFVLRVAPPAVTPACARAYSLCSSVLLEVEDWIRSRELSFSIQDQQLWLGATAIQLAVRNGISQGNKLVAVLSQVGQIQRHPLRADTVLVPLPATEETVSAPIEDSPEDWLHDPDDATSVDSARGQYLTVSGFPALCLIKWSEMQQQRPAGIKIEDLLVQAVSYFVMLSEYQADAAGAEAIPFCPDADASSGQRRRFNEFLTCAQLARRLTVPGVRSASEDGRLSCRTVGLDRQLRIWSGVVQRQETEQVPEIGGRFNIPKASGTVTADLLRKVRPIVYVSEADKRLTRSNITVISQIEDLERSTPELSATSRWLVRYLKLRLKNNPGKEKRASLYQDLTVFLEPFLRALGDADLASETTAETTDIFVSTLGGGCSDPIRALKVIRGIVKQMVADGYDAPDLNVIYEAARHKRTDAEAYLVSMAEATWIVEQLSRWRDPEHLPLLASGDLTFAMESSAFIWELQYWLGLRTAEAAHLRILEVQQVDGEWLLSIRRLRRRGLKTDASVRVLRLANFMPADRIEAFVGFIVRHLSARRKKGDFAAGIFSAPDVDSLVADTRKILAPLGAAMHAILPPGTARPYAGRHIRASYGFQQLLPAAHRSPAWVRPDVPEAPGYLRHLPSRYRLRHWSRSLGHARVTSSLSFYTHSIDDMAGIGQGWPNCGMAAYAVAAGLRLGTLNTRNSRFGILAADTSRLASSLLDFKLGPIISPDPSARPAFLPRPESTRRVESISRTLLWVLEWLAGEKLHVLESRYGIPLNHMLALSAELERCDDLYDAHIVDRSVRLDGIDENRLSPKARHKSPLRIPLALPIANFFDQAEKRHPAAWRAVISHLMEQRRGFADLLHAREPETRRILLEAIDAATKECRKSLSDSPIESVPESFAARARRAIVLVGLIVISRQNVARRSHLL